MASLIYTLGEIADEIGNHVREIVFAPDAEPRGARMRDLCPCGLGELGGVALMATVMHNHLTRDIKPKGECPKCDEHWERVEQGEREIAAGEPLTPVDEV